MTTMFAWTDAAIADLVRLWRADKTAAECAAAMMEIYGGTLTRNAILGKVFRLGLSRADQQTKAVRAAKSRLAKNARAAARKTAKPKPEKPAKPKRSPAPIAPIAPVTPHPALVYDPSRPTLFTVGAMCCRYPLWPNGPAPRPQEAFVCGAPVVVIRKEPKPYCLAHALRMWSQDEARVRAEKAERKRGRGAGGKVFNTMEAA
jgi:GcrA cell cycle regulator